MLMNDLRIPSVQNMPISILVRNGMMVMVVQGFTPDPRGSPGGIGQMVREAALVSLVLIKPLKNFLLRVREV